MRFSLLLLIFITNQAYSQETLTPETLWKFKRINGGQVSPDGKFVLYNQRSFDIANNKGNTDLFLYEFQTNKVRQLTETAFSEMEAQWGPGQRIWFMSREEDGLQLRSIDIQGKNKKSHSFFYNWQAEGFKISPKGSYILAVEPIKTKQTLQEKHPDLPQANARVEDDLMYRHWDHFDDYQRRHLFLYSFENDMISEYEQDVLKGEPYDGILPPMGGMESVTFSNDEAFIFYCSKKKQGKEFALSTNSDLFSFEISTGTTKVISEGLNGYDTNPIVSQDGSIAWLSMKRDGFESDKNDIVVLDQKGNKINLTEKLELTVSEFIWHPSGKQLYFLAPHEGTVQAFEFDVLKKTSRQLSNGQHDFTSISLAGDQLICGLQSMVQPTELYAISITNGSQKQLTHANDSLLKSINMPKVEPHWVKTTDGKKMLVWMVLPPAMKEGKKYPALLYCQGGPQSQVSQFFSYRWNLALMASQGYVVIAPNRRGLPGFGQEWNDAISGDWGGQAMKDYLSATDYASQMAYVDKNRLGAVGASYGGYSVYMLAGIHEKRFKTFVAHCGLFNLESWYGTTEELFFANWDHGGPYWQKEHQKNYEMNSPHRFVQHWDTPILVIHGGLDFRVPESEGFQAFQAAQIKGLRSKLLYFPEEGHWVQSPQNSILWQREFFEWLETDLTP
jgi:dipeptidyl aminopeptidase/acylaminoacyl peptidase